MKKKFFLSLFKEKEKGKEEETDPKKIEEEEEKIVKSQMKNRQFSVSFILNNL